MMPTVEQLFKEGIEEGEDGWRGYEENDYYTLFSWNGGYYLYYNCYYLGVGGEEMIYELTEEWGIRFLYEGQIILENEKFEAKNQKTF